MEYHKSLYFTMFGLMSQCFWITDGSYCYYGGSSGSYYCRYNDEDDMVGLIAAISVGSIIGFAMMVTGIVVCCKVFCCSSSRSQGMVIYPYTPNTGQHISVMSSPQTSSMTGSSSGTGSSNTNHQNYYHPPQQQQQQHHQQQQQQQQQAHIYPSTSQLVQNNQNQLLQAQ